LFVYIIIYFWAYLSAFFSTATCFIR
jgi:hypothetical protein